MKKGSLFCSIFFLLYLEVTNAKAVEVRLGRTFSLIKDVPCLKTSTFCTDVPDTQSDNSSEKESFQTYSPIYRDNMFYRYVKGTTIFIVGPSSTGKTSIIKQIKKRIPLAQRMNFSFSGKDDFFRLLICRSILKSFPEQLSFVNQKDLWHCIAVTAESAGQDDLKNKLIRDVILKKHKQLLLTDEWYTAICKVIDDSFLFSKEEENYLVDNIMLGVVDGKTVFLDVVDFAPFIFSLERNFIRCKIYNIFVYADPLTVIERMKQRTKNSFLTTTKNEMRIFFPFHQYYSIYTISSSPFSVFCMKKEPDLLLKLKKSLFAVIENSDLSLLEKEKFSILLEKGISMRKEYYGKILSEWFKDGLNRVYLKPRYFEPDLLLDTSDLSPKQATSFIVPILDTLLIVE